MNKARFFHQFAALLGAGFSVAQSLSMAAQHEAAGDRRFLQQAIAQVDAGRPLATALRARSSPFTVWEVSLLHLGEMSGALRLTSERLAVLADAHRRRAKLYGSVMRSVSGMGLSLLLLLVSLLAGDDLRWSVLSLGLAVLGLGVMWFAKDRLSLSGRLDFGQGLLRRMPGLSRIMEARSLIVLADLALPLRCGVPVATGLELVRSRIPDPVLARAIAQAERQVRAGQPLSQALAGQVPAMALQMIRTGEEAGALDDMLDKLGEHYEGELERSLCQLEAVLRPVSMLALGLLGLMIGLKGLSALLASLPQ